MSVTNGLTLNSLAAQSVSAHSSDPRVVAGLIYHGSPGDDILTLLRHTKQSAGRSLSEAGHDIARSLNRRFGDRLRTPHSRGLLVIEESGVLKLLSYEQTLTTEGALASIEDWCSQWEAPEDVAHPIYECNVTSDADNQWVARVYNLRWTPRLDVTPTDAGTESEEPSIKTVWTAHKRLARTIWYRYDAGWLLSSSSESLSKVDSPLLKEARGFKRTDDPKKRRLIHCWIRPEQISPMGRQMFLQRMHAGVSVLSQRRDGELSTESHARQVFNRCLTAMIEALLNDVERFDAEVLYDEEQVYLKCRLKTRPGSQSAAFLEEMTPNQRRLLPQMPASGLGKFRLVAQIPGSLLTLIDPSRKPTPVGVQMTGHLNGGPAESLLGTLTLRSGEYQEVLKAMRCLLPHAAEWHSAVEAPWGKNTLVSVTEHPDRNSVQWNIAGPNAGNEASFEPIVTSETDGLSSAAILEVNVSESVLPIVAPDVSAPKDPIESDSTDFPEVRLSLRIHSESIELNVTSSIPTLRKVFRAYVVK